MITTLIVFLFGLTGPINLTPSSDPPHQPQKVDEEPGAVSYHDVHCYIECASYCIVWMP